MYAPIVVDIVTFFYPIGNTSAVHLTRNLPIEESADVLLLGCGDIRNILFTVYTDQDLKAPRRTDVTCCDIESATIARNILLLSLIIDDEDGALHLQQWSIYYHLYLDDACLRLLSAQAAKLYDLATSMTSWNDGRYGQQLNFCDSSTMKRVRDVWGTYIVPETNSHGHKQWVQHANSALQRAMKLRKAQMGEAVSLSGIRSAAPAGIRAAKDAPKLARHFWDHGTTNRDHAGVSKAAHINPMFVTNSSTLHYGTDPLLGFHLATAYSPLKKESPLQSESMREMDLPFKLVEAARAQFEAWTKAFRKSAVDVNTIIRFFAGDAVNFSYALQHANATKRKPANIYHDSYNWIPIVLDSSNYDKAGNASIKFNVIDTSNLIDHVGALNLLAAVAPLLRNGCSSSLYTECLVGREKSQQDYINSLLCGHFPTMSTLMGLFPVEYWTNSSPYSTVDDLLLDSSHAIANVRTNMQQMHIKLTWKQTITGLASHTPDIRAMLQLDEPGLARILHKVYLNMFRHENMQFLLSDFSLRSLSNHSMPRYHRGSFALILRFVRSRVATNWDVTMRHLLDLIEAETTIMMGLNYLQELHLYLHLYNVLSVAHFLPSPTRLDPPIEGRLRKWKDIPSVLCVTMVVPREKLRVITNIDAMELGTPIMHCLIESSRSYKSRRWQNIFSVVQVSFGDLSGTGTQDTDSFQLSIVEDELRWRGSSSLIVSFQVPTWILLLEPQAARVAFGIQSTPAAAHTFLSTLGVEMKIFDTTLGDKSCIHFTKFPPNQKDGSFLLPLPSSGQSTSSTEKPVASSEISGTVDSTTSILTNLTCRLHILSNDLQKALQNGGAVQTHQRSPCTFLETVGPNSTPIVFHFPAPVVRMKSKTRIARKSLYIEVEAPLADTTAWKSFPAHLYPVFLAHGTPILWNLSRLNLGCLPTIDISKKPEIEWLNLHASGTFNTRERHLRTLPLSTDAGSDVRFAFRDSLFSLFMLFPGLQGQQSRLATLNNPADGGVHLVILISSLKIDLSNRTVVLDCAVLPLTYQLLPHLHPFLSALPSQKNCSIKVDAEELQLWKQNLPAMVERCRSWPHKGRCEYQTQSRIPLSTENGQPVVCSCGMGKMPPNFVTGVPHWKSASKYFVRAAISLCFSTAFAEELFDLNVIREKLLSVPA